MADRRLFGCILGKDGVQQEPGKTLAVQNVLLPENVKRLGGFIGLTWSSLSANLSQIRGALVLLMRNKSRKRHSTGKRQQKAFDDIKEKSTAAPVLAFFDDNLETALHVDAGNVACGAVVTQRH